MNVHHLKPTTVSCNIKGDLGVGIESPDIVTVPENIAQVLQRLNISTAEDLAAYLEGFPSIFGSELGWTFTEVKRARRKAMKTLRTVLPDIGFPPAVNPQFSFGALDPNARKPG